ncbi:MAG: hypothetical protein VB858_11325, partial [Planctomycetaceae bacterium]
MSQVPSRPVGLTALLGCWLIAAALRPAASEDWAQFRGPNASGIAAESQHPPVEFSTEQNVAWSVELGRGVACPVIADGRCFATTMTQSGQFA